MSLVRHHSACNGMQTGRRETVSAGHLCAIRTFRTVNCRGMEAEWHHNDGLGQSTVS